jgi:NAD+ diphosphatase
MSYPESVNLPFNQTILAEQFVAAHPDALTPPEDGWWVILSGQSLVVREEKGLLTLPHGSLLPSWLKRTPIYLGSWRGEPLKALRLSKDDIIPPPFRAEPFNAAEERLPEDLLTVGGLALQRFHWQRFSRFCSRCGATMEPIAATHGLRCSSCHAEHFPHIHPCVIVLVRRGDQFLLGRKAQWPAGRYSLVAGFLDMGESLEECVVREVREETGIEVRNIRYVGSQNWPFPSQLMAGFVADWAGGEISVDGEELEDARWFSLKELPASLPARRSIARWIIERFALNAP